MATPKQRASRRSADEQIQFLHQKALHLTFKTSYIRIAQKLKQNKHILADVEKHIDRLLSSGSGSSSGKYSTPTKAQEKVENDCQTTSKNLGKGMALPVGCAKGGDSDDFASSAGADDVASSGLQPGDGELAAASGGSTDELPHCYTTIGGCSLTYLKAMLSAIEPIAFSALSLRGMIERGKREVSKRSLTELIEFASGCDYDTPLNGDLRHIPTLHRALSDMSRARGRLGRDLRLPPNFDEVGFFVLEGLAGPQPSLRHRFLNCARPLPLAKFNNSMEEVASARVEMNYSEHRAFVSTKRGFKVLTCVTMFSDLIQDPPSLRPSSFDDPGRKGAAAPGTKVGLEDSAAAEDTHDDGGMSSNVAAPRTGAGPASAMEEPPSFKAEVECAEAPPPPPDLAMPVEPAPVSACSSKAKAKAKAKAQGKPKSQVKTETAADKKKKAAQQEGAKKKKMKGGDGARSTT